WRHYLELRWTVRRTDGSFVVGRPLELSIQLRNRSGAPLGTLSVRPIASSSLDIGPVGRRVLGACTEVTFSTQVVPRRMGVGLIHGAVVDLQDRLGVASLQAYFPS